MASISEQLRRWQEKQSINQPIYKTKKIHYFGKDVPVILQSKNGPCPLIAICNVLLLRGTYNLSADVTQVSEGELLTFVAEKLYNALNKDGENSYTVADAIDLTPSLTAGMILDLKFQRIDDFVLTRDIGVFGLLGMRLVHGWLVDPQDTETAKAIGSMSYNDLTKELVMYEFLDKHLETIPESSSLEKEDIDPTSANSDGVISEPISYVVESSNKMKETIAGFSSLTTESLDVVFSEPTSNLVKSSKKMKDIAESSSSASASDDNEGKLIQRFLDSNQAQLTVYGLFCLQAGLAEKELCVFFRNNHFNTMLRYLGEVYILATDEGYVDEPGVVWEKLIEENGDTVFVNSNFEIFNSGDQEIGKIPEFDLKSDKEKESDLKSDEEKESDLKSDEKKESGLKIVKKKDLATVMNEFEDFFEGLEGGSAFNPVVQQALEELGIDENELLYGSEEEDIPGPEEEEIPDSEDKSVKPKPKKKGQKTVINMFEDHFAKLNKTQGNLRFRPNVIKALELLDMTEKDLFPHLFPDPPEVENTGPEPETKNPDPQSEAANPDPQPETKNPDPQPEPANPDPQPEAANPDPQPEAAKPRPQPEAAKPRPQPEAVNQGPQPETKKPDPQPETKTPDPQPETKNPDAQPKAAKPRPQPEAGNHGPQPEVRNPGPQPDVRNPGPQPKPEEKKLTRRRPRISSKKVKQVIKEKCNMM